MWETVSSILPYLMAVSGLLGERYYNAQIEQQQNVTSILTKPFEERYDWNPARMLCLGLGLVGVALISIPLFVLLSFAYWVAMK